MHVIVVGGGIIGSLSAYYLNQAGARVTLLEREADFACGTSGMNAAQLSYSYVSPLGSPAIYGLLRKVIAGKVEDVKVTKWADPQLIGWGIRLLRESSKERYKANQNALLALALESKELMGAFRAKHNIDFDYAECGKLHLYITPEQIETARGFAKTMEKYGVHQEFLSPEECRAREPSVKDRTGPLAGGVFSPIDYVGDCRKFTRGLKAVLAAAGVACRTGAAVARIVTKGGAFEALEMADGSRVAGDAVLVCAGAESYQLLKTAGLRVPLYPVKGYSATVDNAPIGLTMNVTDHARRVVYAPLGKGMRVSGYVHFSGYDMSVTERTRATFLKLIPDVFPQARVPDDVPIEVGFRPYLPTTVPVTGPTKVKGLHINIGHSALGWTLSHATCKRAAETILK